MRPDEPGTMFLSANHQSVKYRDTTLSDISNMIGEKRRGVLASTIV